MTVMRESWTDARLDDFTAETARRFDTLGRHMDQRFDQIDKRFERADERIVHLEERITERFEALQHLMIQFGGVLIVGLLGLIATQL